MSDEREKPKRRGRPPKAPHDRQSKNFTFRVREGLREMLEADAKLGNRSISEELERRLLQSYRSAGDALTDTALGLISDSWRAIQTIMRGTIFTDQKVLLACAEASKNTLLHLACIINSDLVQVHELPDQIRKRSESIGQTGSSLKVLLKNSPNGDNELSKTLMDILVEQIAEHRSEQDRDALVQAFAQRREAKENLQLPEPEPAAPIDKTPARPAQPRRRKTRA